MTLSIIIPAHKEPYLQQTIDDLLNQSELGDKLEIIAVCDGYWPDPPLKEDPRVHIIHHGKIKQMRNSINEGVRAARGEFIMRVDAHCTFGKGYDRILTQRFKDNWLVYPKRYYLDPVKWEVMDKEPNIYNKLVIDESRHKFAGVNWKSREKKRAEKMIDESFAMQGSVWICKKKLWEDVIGELDAKTYGPMYGDSHEMSFKIWKAGGRLMVNKNTWHSHKHRDFPRSHNHGEKEAREGWDNAIKIWGEYYRTVIKPRQDKA